MLQVISSLQNPRIKHAASLRDHKHRVASRQFVIDGEREIQRAQVGGIVFRELFVCQELLSSNHVVEAILEGQKSLEPTWVSERVFAKLAYGDRSDGLVAIADTPSRNLDQFEIHENTCVGILESVEKPGNIGAVIRSAAAAGLDGVICADCPTDLYNHNIIRASLGSLFRIPVLSARSDQVRDWLKKHEFRAYVARVDAAIPYTDVDFSGRIALVAGSEATGLSNLWTGPDVTPIVIPMSSTSDSLNVSVAAAILFFRLRCERDRQPDR